MQLGSRYIGSFRIVRYSMWWSLAHEDFFFEYSREIRAESALRKDLGCTKTEGTFLD